MSEAPEKDKAMPFLQHLSELRSCMVHAACGIFVGAILSLTWAEAIFHFITSPLKEHFPNAELIGTGPAEAFVVKLKVAFACGILLSLPYTFFQVWRFVSPGLYQKEKQVAIPFVVGSTVCFLCGVAFCFFVAFPFGFEFFSDEFVSIGVKPSIRIGEYLSFAVTMLLVFGTMFELPMFSYFLTRMRLITHKWLMKNFRYAVVVIFIVAGILTPPDVMSQMLLGIPLLILYGICIVVAYHWRVAPKGSSPADHLPTHVGL